MTIDYRRANLLIRSDQYPLPLAERLIRHVSQYKYYIQLDLGEGYYNIKCTDTLTRKLLAFKTGDGKLYYWNVMPQGSKNAPAIFQAAMEKILAHHIDQGTARVYLDDLVLCSLTPLTTYFIPSTMYLPSSAHAVCASNSLNPMCSSHASRS